MWGLFVLWCLFCWSIYALVNVAKKNPEKSGAIAKLAGKAAADWLRKRR
jgi:hypothetical protein